MHFLKTLISIIVVVCVCGACTKPSNTQQGTGLFLNGKHLADISVYHLLINGNAYLYCIGDNNNNNKLAYLLLKNNGSSEDTIWKPENVVSITVLGDLLDLDGYVDFVGKDHMNVEYLRLSMASDGNAALSFKADVSSAKQTLTIVYDDVSFDGWKSNPWND